MPTLKRRKKKLSTRGEKETETSNEKTLKQAMQPNMGGETNQKRKDFLWVPVFQ